MKSELRIPASEVEHDALLTDQITAAVNFAMQSTGTPLADLHLLRPAIVSSVRDQYDGYREVSEDSATYRWLEPFRRRV